MSGWTKACIVIVTLANPIVGILLLLYELDKAEKKKKLDA